MPDWGTVVGAALTTTIADFGDGLAAIVPVTFGLSAAVLIYHRVKGLIH